MTTSVREAYADVGRRMIEACSRAQRDPGSVRLVAITKTLPVPRIRELLACGHRLLGENRVQEALPKIDALGPAADWHFVGHLQSNKVRQAAGRFDLIHGVDGEKLAREIGREASRVGAPQPVLLQVNLSGEVTKFGVPPERVEPLLDALADQEHLEVRGFMTVPPPVAHAEDSRRWFARLRELRDACSARSGLGLDELSMGMTDDFEVAIEEGATLIRVGRALFGERPAVG